MVRIHMAGRDDNNSCDRHNTGVRPIHAVACYKPACLASSREDEKHPAGDIPADDVLEDAHDWGGAHSPDVRYPGARCQAVSSPEAAYFLADDYYREDGMDWAAADGGRAVDERVVKVGRQVEVLEGQAGARVDAVVPVGPAGVPALLPKDKLWPQG